MKVAIRYFTRTGHTKMLVDAIMGLQKCDPGSSVIYNSTAHGVHELVGLSTREIIQYGLHLAFVPEDLKTESMCRTAVQLAPAALRFVPERFLTERLCLREMRLLKDGSEVTLAFNMTTGASNIREIMGW